MKKLLKNIKGMTMIELLVAMAVFSVIATTTGALVSPLIRAYRAANDLAEVNTLLDNVSLEMLSDLADAAEVVPGADLTIRSNRGTIVYTINGAGLLCKNGQPVLDALFYRGRTVAYSWAASGDAITVTFTLSSGHDRAYTVRPLGLY